MVETVSMLRNDLSDNSDFVGLEGPRCPINSISVVKWLN